MKTIILQ